ncbi:hypothetical protein SG34_009360 [Thalassomonas viridans]|uniref:Uncharacterized protein n=1 Tax=Thalassomonas viridans TaxID=137584 RepID=A0AAE9Z5E3_9GAMM|nr:hypothetical protein [Thalassomonas viridans]WDE07071.1 hypothetical protein SG34_009360 [Thalassomonas viridans]
MKFRLLISMLALLLSFTVRAHDGHDHLAPEAALFHLLWIIPGIIALAVLAGKVYLNSLSKTYNISQVKKKKY